MCEQRCRKPLRSVGVGRRARARRLAASALATGFSHAYLFCVLPHGFRRREPACSVHAIIKLCWSESQRKGRTSWYGKHGATHTRDVFNTKNTSSYHTPISLVLTNQPKNPFTLVVVAFALQCNPTRIRINAVQLRIWTDTTKSSKIWLTCWIILLLTLK